MNQAPIDRAVQEAAEAFALTDLATPDVLVLAATGLGALPGRLEDVRELRLDALPGVPASWRHLTVQSGRRGEHGILLWTDAPGEPELGGAPTSAEPAWVRGFPCWLAAAVGARVLVHVSAGSALPVADAERRLAAGELALVSDHINLSGRSPLVGLGESRLGPLFPDQSTLHNRFLRERALALAAEHGLGVKPAVAACTLGPTVETPAERAWLATTGANVAVQGLANPLIAAAHAALATLAIVAVVDDGTGRLDLPGILARADRLAPAIDDLVGALLPDLGRVARELDSEEDA